jgi:3-phosphoshikimate 1-carboxyvinyltransferase
VKTGIQIQQKIMSNLQNTTFSIKPGGVLRGEILVPGDKSISHRAVMLSSLAKGTTEVHGFLEGEDCLATVRAFQNMGVTIRTPAPQELQVKGVGLHGLHAAKHFLDLGNSGTAIRLLTGILAGQTFDSSLTGDSSLQKRPMLRIAKPLVQMGAKIALQPGGVPPIYISGNQKLQGIHYEMPVASAQVKSCLLLAGLYASGETKISEPAATRDHTERMLEAFSYPVQYDDSSVSITGGGKLKATEIYIPSDISSAAFFMVGASIATGSEILLKNIGINPRRTGVINILGLMGGDIEILNERMLNQEPVADIRVRSRPLLGIDIPLDQVPLAIDEFPALFIAAACAQGTTTLRKAEELRVKESDRLRIMAEGLEAVGIKTELYPDGIRIEGGTMQGGRINSAGDHRIAMAFAMAGLVAKKEIIIDDCANVVTSFPGFVELAQKAGLKINESFHTIERT